MIYLIIFCICIFIYLLILRKNNFVNYNIYENNEEIEQEYLSENIYDDEISNTINSEVVPEEQEYNKESKDVTQCLSGSYEDLFGLGETLKTGTELVNKNIRYLNNIQAVKGSKKLNNINSLEYKRALIDASKIQGFEDTYLYKLNETLN